MTDPTPTDDDHGVMRCPRCLSLNARCQPKPHMHFCIDCGYNGEASRDDDLVGDVTRLRAEVRALRDQRDTATAAAGAALDYAEGRISHHAFEKAMARYSNWLEAAVDRPPTGTPDTEEVCEPCAAGDHSRCTRPGRYSSGCACRGTRHNGPHVGTPDTGDDT
jgi:hypothetical protein